MNELADKLWRQLQNEVEWHLRNRGDVQVHESDIRDISSSMADGLLGVVLRFQGIGPYLDGLEEG